MKSLCSVFLGVAALAYVLACSSAALTEDMFLMPRLPTKEERIRLQAEAEQNGEGLRLPRPPAGVRRRGVGAAATADHKGIKPNIRPPVHTGPREPQHDIAGTVTVKRDGDLRIIDGQKAKIGQFPWQAGILEKFSGAKSWCGGSIIHSLWILTAAHCVDDSPLSYTIVVGSVGSEKGSEPSRLEISEIDGTYQHAMYNNHYIDNDIGVIKLSDHIKFNAYVRPVQLPSYSMAVDMMVGTVGTVSGWGLTSDYAEWISPDLMYIDNKIDNGKACYDVYGNSWIPNKICINPTDGKSFCSGDSGGAFTFEESPGKHTQIGIVSFGAAAGCEKKYPIAYTRLASFLDFIEETTNIAVRD